MSVIHAELRYKQMLADQQTALRARPSVDAILDRLIDYTKQDFTLNVHPSNDSILPFAVMVNRDAGQAGTLKLFGMDVKLDLTLGPDQWRLERKG